jgi:hypothetical protein
MKNELEQQIEKVDAAITMLEGQLNEPKSTKDKVKSLFYRFVPMSKNTGINMQKQFQELSYSILVVQKQFLTFVNAINKNQGSQKYEDKGHGQYQ